MRFACSVTWLSLKVDPHPVYSQVNYKYVQMDVESLEKISISQYSSLYVLILSICLPSVSFCRFAHRSLFIISTHTNFKRRSTALVVKRSQKNCFIYVPIFDTWSMHRKSTICNWNCCSTGRQFNNPTTIFNARSHARKCCGTATENVGLSPDIHHVFCHGLVGK